MNVSRDKMHKYEIFSKKWMIPFLLALFLQPNKHKSKLLCNLLWSLASVSLCAELSQMWICRIWIEKNEINFV